MRDRQRWMCRFCWLSVFVTFHLLTILQCSYTHRKVPQRKSRQAVEAQETADGIPGVWSSWGPWSACSSSCGIGIAQQSRRCVPQEPEGQRWALQPRGPYPPPRPSHGEGQYSGRAISALRPTYSLHVDSEPPTFSRGQSPTLQAQQEPAGHQQGEASNQHSLPLYADQFAPNQPEDGVFRHRHPTNGESTPHQRYRQLSNRGSIPLYRQHQPSNHDRQQLAANRDLSSSYGVQSLTNREASPLYIPEGSSYQGTGSQPRQRSLANWRASTGNRRSLMIRQELRSSNRSHSRSAIRPGQYGYGKVPSNFQLRGAMAHLLQAAPSAQHSRNKRGAELRPEGPVRRRRGRDQGPRPGLQREEGEGDPPCPAGPPDPSARLHCASGGTADRAARRGRAAAPSRRRRRRSPGRGPGSEPGQGGSRPRKQRPPRGSGSGSGSRARRQQQPGGEEPGPQRWAAAACPGAGRRYQTCSLSACPSSNVDPRKAQCAGFNHLQFMGRYYEWEPFTEVRKDQQCELNCRPTGYRFYVRHADRVLDGTPCEANSTDVCVGGLCLTAGCDGMLGSAAQPDKCGVCGGDGSSCQRVFGMFEDSQVNVGYHKIIEIPVGATRINVTEVARSRNYLALRSQSGQSIINGNWAIDRPGKYEAAGTVFMYKRPTETSGESFYAEGPTTESLVVYMIFQQDNPGIHYEFVLPVEKPAHPPQNSHHPAQSYGSVATGGLREVSALASGPVVAHHGNVGPYPASAGGAHRGNVGAHQGSPVAPRARGGQRDRRLQVYHTDAEEDPAQPQPVFHWTSQRTTECSVSCGKGFQYPIFDCVAQDTQELVPSGHCDVASKPASVAEACNTHACPAFWSVGAWSQCSKTCGRGIHNRQVLCRQAYANRTVTVHHHSCSHLEKPNATQPCEARACTHWQIQTDWESCSVPCGVGQRKRSIRCVSNQGNVVGEGECSAKQKPTDSETCDMGPCVKTWFYTDWSSKCSVECGIGVQKRSVLCLTNYINDRSPEGCEGPRPPETRACTRPHCQHQVRWYTSPWNQCPVQCGNGTQNRDLICVIKLGNNFTVTAPADCAHLDKPPSVQPCSAGPCGARWFITGWSECSKSCMGGVQVREVRCLDDAGFPSSLCDVAEKPSDQRICHSHPCIPELDENCKDKHYNCPVVVQARLCVYSYYKMVCCASCTHAERRASDPRHHGVSGRRGGGA